MFYNGFWNSCFLILFGDIIGFLVIVILINVYLLCGEIMRWMFFLEMVNSVFDEVYSLDVNLFRCFEYWFYIVYESWDFLNWI